MKINEYTFDRDTLGLKLASFLQVEVLCVRTEKLLCYSQFLVWEWEWEKE